MRGKTGAFCPEAVCGVLVSAVLPGCMSPELDRIRASTELPPVGAFTDVGHDDVVDETVLEVVVTQVAGQPERLGVAPVPAACVDAQRGGSAGAAFAFVGARLDEATDFELPVLDCAGDGVGGDDGDVLVRGVDEIAVTAADVVLRIRQPLEEGVGADVEAGALQGFVPAAGAGELAELGVPVLGAVGGEAVAGG
ncbi:hypothetical protein AB0L42_45080 [Streptomyces sp. NPDC052287]|uniref:hypothetical protein n=1 Tax=Streptomyces sp. NPDC052287 TaxID=3154950 RepID=UPI00342FE1A0